MALLLLKHGKVAIIVIVFSLSFIAIGVFGRTGGCSRLTRAAKKRSNVLEIDEIMTFVKY